MNRIYCLLGILAGVALGMWLYRLAVAVAPVVTHADPERAAVDAELARWKLAQRIGKAVGL